MLNPLYYCILTNHTETIFKMKHKIYRGNCKISHVLDANTENGSLFGLYKIDPLF
jgi:hypothetical protein